MHWFPFIFVFFAGLNYDAYTEETIEKATFGSKVQVVAFPSRTYPPTTTDIADTQVSFGSSSFQGSCALAASEEVTPQAICDNGFGKLWPMEMPRLQETLQGNGTVLPLMWDRLVQVCRQHVHPRSALQRLVLGESSAMEWSHTWLEFTKDKIGFRKKAFETFTPVREERKRERQGEELRDSQRRSAVKESICSSFGSLALDWRCGDYSDDFGCQCYATTQSSFRSAVSLELKKMYPDPAQMPSELQAAVEKTEAQSSKQVTRDLHSATSQLGRAKKSLADSKEARSKHRKAWFTYLAECATVWKEQQVAFSEREQLLRAQEEKSRLEIVQITSQIQQLTNKNVAESGLGATSPAIPPVDAQEGQEDEVEEKKLKEAAQEALQLCLTSVKEEPEAIMVESDKDDPDGANPPAKRPRSVDPNGGHGLPSVAGGT